MLQRALVTRLQMRDELLLLLFAAADEFKIAAQIVVVILNYVISKLIVFREVGK